MSTKQSGDTASSRPTVDRDTFSAAPVRQMTLGSPDTAVNAPSSDF
jgi:hypothetical protein